MAVNRAIIIVDHGSRLDEANRMLEDVASLLRQRTDEPVYAAHMELASPTIADAFDRAVADGATEIIIFPYFLAPGRHSRQDVPGMCAEAAAKHPHVAWHCTGPVGCDPIMVGLILDRVQQCRRNGYSCERCPDANACGPGHGDQSSP